MNLNPDKLREIATAKRDEAKRAADAEYEATIAAIEKLVAMSSGNGAQPKNAPPFNGYGEAVSFALGQMIGDFTINDVSDFLENVYPNESLNRQRISAELWRARTVYGTVETVREGSGRSPATYRKNRRCKNKLGRLSAYTLNRPGC